MTENTGAGEKKRRFRLPKFQLGLRTRVTPRKGVRPAKVHIGGDMFVVGTFVLELMREATIGAFMVGGVFGFLWLVLGFMSNE